MENYLFTSESVSEGHPDKICDQISDAILDAYFCLDKESRVAIECMIKDNLLVIAGEVNSKADVNLDKIALDLLYGLGYRDEFQIIKKISNQSEDISLGVDECEDKEQGAGDQGLMFGFATDENEDFMPTPIMLSHKLLMKLSKVRNENTIGYLKADAKSQVTVEYEKGKPKRIHTVVLSCQHKEEISMDKLRDDITSLVIKPICGDLLDENTIIYINPTGKFVKGGSFADAGLTGRKIIVDSYGGFGRHGGGCFSGKDPSKVDRSGAYLTRYIAKNIVASGLANKCEVQIGYSIGIADPVSINVNCFGTNNVGEEEIIDLIKRHFPLKPKDIIEKLNLKRPIYLKTACFGHFGRNDKDFAWEKTDKKELLSGYMK